MDELDQVGPRLRAARLAHGWTLEDLAGRAGMSVSTLSRLESGKRAASLELLLPLTRELRLRLDDLVRPQVPDPRVRRVPVHRGGHVLTPLSAPSAPVQAYRITFAPVESLPPLKVHDGYEWLLVLSGRLRLRLADQDVVLARGEAADFDTSVPHALSAVGPRPAEVLSIFNEAGERLHTRAD